MLPGKAFQRKGATDLKARWPDRFVLQYLGVELLCMKLEITKITCIEKLVIIIKVGTVTDSGMGMHHVVTIFTLAFIQDLNHENNKCTMISETFQGMPNKFAVKTVRIKVDFVQVNPRQFTWPAETTSQLLR